MDPIQHQAITSTPTWFQALWALLLAPLSVPKVREFFAEWLWHKWFPKKEKPKKDFFERREADQLEIRLTSTLQANHDHTIRELKDHDERIRVYNKENREWMEGRLDRFDSKIDNYLAMLAMGQRNK